jgi:hypothetical protein
MRGDEARVVVAFHAHLEREGWSVTREADFCDLVAVRDGSRLFVEAKGRTTAPGLDIDTMYGQILRRMPFDDDSAARFAVVVPDVAARAALRVKRRVRELLRIDIYTVSEAGEVVGPVAD